VEAIRAFVGFLYQQASQDAQLTATLTLLELPNLMVLLDHVSAAGDPAATIDLATQLFTLLQLRGKPHLLEKVGAVRDAAAQLLGEHWSHAQFESQRTRITTSPEPVGCWGASLNVAARLSRRCPCCKTRSGGSRRSSGEPPIAPPRGWLRHR
jgi:hypothetical protein